MSGEEWNKMIQRPVFTDKLTVEEFNKHYWYKTDLQAICRQYNLSVDGTKAELEQGIRAFLSGESHDNKRTKVSKIRKSTTSQQPISLDTKLIGGGFKFNHEARVFFADYFNVAKFSFTKAMAVALREAEENQDYDMTVADLVEIYLDRSNTVVEQSTDEKSYQWNKFVRDFNKDPQSNIFHEKMKVAAILWSKVRDNPIQKVYDNFLIEKHFNEVKQFQKK